MTDAKDLEKVPAERPVRRPYEPPVVRDFLQPLVVLGTVTNTFGCTASPKPPKH